MTTIPETYTLVHTFSDGDYPVSLYKLNAETFAVEYGCQTSVGLSYSDAAKEYGQCVMHSLACASKLDD